MEKLKNYINGKLVEPVSGKYLDNYEPATGKVYSLVPDSDVEDVQLAVNAAKTAFDGWSKTALEDRMMILLQVADGIEKRMDEFVARRIERIVANRLSWQEPWISHARFPTSGFMPRQRNTLPLKATLCPVWALIIRYASRLA